jgi:hypothetical protein
VRQFYTGLTRGAIVLNESSFWRKDGVSYLRSGGKRGPYYERPDATGALRERNANEMRKKCERNENDVGSC